MIIRITDIHIFVFIKALNEYWPELLLWLLAIAAFFLQIGYMPLSADEPIRAIVAYNMELTGEYVIPYVNGDVYLNKPPLYNWILLGFFVLFGSHEEWVVRMPAVLSIILFGIYLYRFIKSETENKHLAFLVAMAFMTTGNLLFYTSYFGHIDATYSLFTFAGFVVVYRGVKYGEWLTLFMFSYIICWAGFMMKGLPSLLFTALTISSWLIAKGQWKKLFSLEHFTGIATFITLLAAYFVLYKKKMDISPFFERLWSESSQRTVADKGLVESVKHLFEFPYKFLLDMAPWGLLVLLIPFRRFRKHIFSNDLSKFAVMVFLVNIIVYWLSPDYRARYVFMLMPLLLIALFTPITKDNSFKLLGNVVGIVGVIFIILAIITGVYFYSSNMYQTGAVIVSSLGLLWLLFTLLFYKQPYFGWKSLIAFLFIARIAFTFSLKEESIDESAFAREKMEGLEIAEITEGYDLAMYYSNVNLTTNWYISTSRMKPLETVRDGDTFNLNEFYLIPADVLTDTTNYTEYYSFTRRYKNKPFKLVKFKEYFPVMPKSNTDAKNITGHSGNE